MFLKNLSKKFVEGRFVEDGDSERLGFGELRTGVGSNDDVVCFLADGRPGFAALLGDERFGLFARAARERAGKHESHSGEFRTLGRFAFFFHVHTDGA